MSEETKTNNEKIIDNYIESILKDFFIKGYQLGKIDKEILDIEESKELKELFNSKLHELKKLFIM
jgi:hypothetical protein